MTEDHRKQMAASHEPSPEESARLTHSLSGSIDSGSYENPDAAWAAELRRRFEDLQSGRVVGIPAEQVFAELRKKYEQSDRPQP